MTGDNKTTNALYKKLMDELRNKAKEVETYKAENVYVQPEYEFTPEQMFEKPQKYERQVYYPKSSEEINQTVKDSLSADYDAGKESITANALSDIAAIEKKRQQAAEDKYYALNSLDKKYDELMRKKQAKMIDNGLSRSSIKEQLAGDIKAESDNKKSAADLKYELKDALLADDIKEQEETLKRKLDEFERKYQTNYAKQVEALTQSEKKKANAATKANEGLTEKEMKETAQYVANVEGERQRRKQAEADALKKYERELNNFEQNNMLERYNTAKDILLSMQPETADKILSENTELQNLLGERYCKQLRYLIRKDYVGKLL